MYTQYLEMTTIITQPGSVDFARRLGGLERFFYLIDQHRAVHFTMAAKSKDPRPLFLPL
jgi:hypothetical protein